MYVFTVRNRFHGMQHVLCPYNHIFLKGLSLYKRANQHNLPNNSLSCKCNSEDPELVYGSTCS